MAMLARPLFVLTIPLFILERPVCLDETPICLALGFDCLCEVQAVLLSSLFVLLMPHSSSLRGSCVYCCLVVATICLARTPVSSSSWILPKLNFWGIFSLFEAHVCLLSWRGLSLSWRRHQSPGIIWLDAIYNYDLLRSRSSNYFFSIFVRPF